MSFYRTFTMRIRKKSKWRRRKKKNRSKRWTRSRRNLGLPTFKGSSTRLFKKNPHNKSLEQNRPKNLMQVLNLSLLLTISNHKCQKPLKTSSKRISNISKKSRKNVPYKNKKKNKTRLKSRNSSTTSRIL